MGIEFTLGSFSEKNLINNKVSDEGFEVNVAYFLRLYFYSGGNIQLGLGISNHFMEDLDARGYDYSLKNALDVNMNYYNMSIEVPLQIRLGFTIVKELSPFISYKFTYRKPIFYTAEFVVSHYDNDFIKEDKSNFYSEDDHEFNMWFGAGLQITRGIIIGAEWLIFSEAEFAHIYDDGFRLNFDFAW